MTFPGTDDEDPAELFLAHLGTIERAIRYASRRASLRDEDAEDFASYVKLKLIDRNYAVIRKYERRASFAAFISVVVQRLLLDYRIGQWGKWHASTEAKRIGEPAVTIEAFLYRDGRTVDEALPALIRRWPWLSREKVASIVCRLPARTPRLRTIGLDLVSDTVLTLTADEPRFESEQHEVARCIAATVREAVNELSEHDRLIFRLRFERGMSVAEISRTLRIEQKPLYRRLRRALAMVKARLVHVGVSAADVEEVLANPSADLDFGFEVPPAVSHSPSDEEKT